QVGICLMPFDWTEYARLAEELRARDDEASSRTAISRAYYSVYHQARSYILDEGLPLSKYDSSHKADWNRYRDLGGSCRAVGITGDRLHDNRTQADYDNKIRNVRQLVDETFRMAANILVYLEQCKTSRR